METANNSLSSNPVSSLSESESEFFSGRTYIFISISLKFGLFPLFGIAALCANIINTVVNQRICLSDGITQNFFILSISDGLFAMTAVINFMAYVLLTITRTYKRFGYLELDAQWLYRLSYFPPIFPHYVSVATTVVIAVVRSCCVAMPLRVKDLFTARRQLAAILILSGLGIFAMAYAVAPVQLVQWRDPVTNNTIVFYDGIRYSLLTSFINFSFFGSFIVVFISLIVLWRSLTRAAKFRLSAGTSGLSNANSDHADKTVQTKAKETQRDTRVVRTVILVSAVFMVTNVPLMVQCTFRLFLEGYGPSGRHKKVHDFVLMVAEITSMCNASVNIFIYIFNSTRYHSTFFALFGRQKNIKVSETKQILK